MSARFTRTREDFRCEQCGADVRGDGYTNHCPYCLWSKHVDVRPGDRAAECGALMRPVATLPDGDRWVVVQQCTGCGHRWRNRAAARDRRGALLALVGEPVREPPTRPTVARSARPTRPRRRSRR